MCEAGAEWHLDVDCLTRAYSWHTALVDTLRQESTSTLAMEVAFLLTYLCRVLSVSWPTLGV